MADKAIFNDESKYLGLPLPNPRNPMAEDCLRIGNALRQLDAEAKATDEEQQLQDERLNAQQEWLLRHDENIGAEAKARLDADKDLAASLTAVEEQGWWLVDEVKKTARRIDQAPTEDAPGLIRLGPGLHVVEQEGAPANLVAAKLAPPLQFNEDGGVGLALAGLVLNGDGALATDGSLGGARIMDDSLALYCDSENGSDANDGRSWEGAYQTLERALDEMEAITFAPGFGCAIRLAAGNYAMGDRSWQGRAVSITGPEFDFDNPEGAATVALRSLTFERGQLALANLILDETGAEESAAKLISAQRFAHLTLGGVRIINRNIETIVAQFHSCCVLRAKMRFTSLYEGEGTSDLMGIAEKSNLLVSMGQGEMEVQGPYRFLFRVRYDSFASLHDGNIKPRGAGVPKLLAALEINYLSRAFVSKESGTSVLAAFGNKATAVYGNSTLLT